MNCITVRVTMNNERERWTCDHCKVAWVDGDNLMETGISSDVVHDRCWEAHIEKELLRKLSK